MEGCELFAAYQNASLPEEDFEDFFAHLDECEECEAKFKREPPDKLETQGAGALNAENGVYDAGTAPERDAERSQTAKELTKALDPLIEAFDSELCSYNRRLLRIEEFVKRLDEQRQAFADRLHALELARKLILANAGFLGLTREAEATDPETENRDSAPENGQEPDSAGLSQNRGDSRDRPIGEVALDVLKSAGKGLTSRQIATRLSQSHPAYKGKYPGRLSIVVGRSLGHAEEHGLATRETTSHGPTIWRATG